MKQQYNVWRCSVVKSLRVFKNHGGDGAIFGTGKFIENSNIQAKIQSQNKELLFGWDLDN